MHRSAPCHVGTVGNPRDRDGCSIEDQATPMCVCRVSASDWAACDNAPQAVFFSRQRACRGVAPPGHERVEGLHERGCSLQGHRRRHEVGGGGRHLWQLHARVLRDSISDHLRMVARSGRTSLSHAPCTCLAHPVRAVHSPQTPPGGSRCHTWWPWAHTRGARWRLPTSQTHSSHLCRAVNETHKCADDTYRQCSRNSRCRCCFGSAKCPQAR